MRDTLTRSKTHLQDGATLTPQDVIDHYRRAYQQVHGQQPLVVHMFAEWYQANGETVHRVTLLHEISRLRVLAQEQRLQQMDRNLITRLIGRLRGL